MSSLRPGAIGNLIARLNRPVLGTRVVPAEAGVSVELFSEEAFPVYCPGCGYLLRGLPDSNCPECGRPFERGRLLVEQYVRERAHSVWEHGWAGRWAKRLAIVTLGLYVGYPMVVYAVVVFAPGLLNWLPKPQGGAYLDWVRRFNQVAHWIEVILLAGLLICLFTAGRAYRATVDKRRRVLDALPNEAKSE